MLFSSYIYKFSAGLANENQDLEKLDWKFVCYYSLRDSLRGNSVQFMFITAGNTLFFITARFGVSLVSPYVVPVLNQG